jgi:xylulokinase
MMTKYFIGIDVSTTASKALAIDEQGNVVVSKSYPHDLSTPRPLWSEQDPENWWEATSHALRDVTAAIPADQIAAIGLTGQMHGLTSMDADGRILRPAILWNDQRSGAQCEAVTERVGAQRLYEIVGTRMLSGFTGPKIAWLKDNEPEVYKQIAHVLLPKDYIRYRLSAVSVARTLPMWRMVLVLPRWMWANAPGQTKCWRRLKFRVNGCRNCVNRLRSVLTSTKQGRRRQD